MDWQDRIGRRLKLRDLHTFFAVAQRGSMAKAAADLSLTQPAVSKTIADLEDLLGVRLLDRTPRGVELTRYGEALRKWGIVVFDDLKQAVQEIRQLADPISGELRIGSSDPFMAGLLPAVIGEVVREYPRITFDVIHGTQSVLLYEDLRERKLDLVVGRMPAVLDDDLEGRVLSDDPLRVAAAQRNPWVRRRNVRIADLVDEPWVLPRIDSLARSALFDSFRASGVGPPRVCVSSSSINMQMALLASERFLTVFPRSLLRFGAKPSPIKFLSVELSVQPPPVGVVTLKNRTKSPIAQLFIARVHAIGAEHG